jgi:uncharacterized protein
LENNRLSMGLTFLQLKQHLQGTQGGAVRRAWHYLMVAIGLQLFCVSAAFAQAQVPIPPLATHVTDSVGMLNATQRAALESTLSDYETRTGTQIGILLISTTEPEAIEQYSIRVADAWKLGRKGVDDGVILIVAKDNPKALRRLRLEVGRGVQGTLTDAQSNRILQDVIAPHFRQNDFYGGLVAAVSALQTVLNQEHLPVPASAAQTTGKQHTSNQQGSDLASYLPFLIIIVIGMVMAKSRRSRSGSSLSSNGWGRAAGVILGSQIGSSLGRGGGFGGGFGSGGGGFGGGGFSGGGGGFDGGGASGNW